MVDLIAKCVGLSSNYSKVAGSGGGMQSMRHPSVAVNYVEVAANIFILSWALYLGRKKVHISHIVTSKKQ